MELPDYAALTKPLIEVCTLDSETCAACTYMMGAANEIKEYFGDRIDVVEYKYIYKEDIARFAKMGVAQLPSIYINGELAYSSIIPSKADFIKRVEQVLPACPILPILVTFWLRSSRHLAWSLITVGVSL